MNSLPICFGNSIIISVKLVNENILRNLERGFLSSGGAKKPLEYSVIIHELCHCFGGDASASFSLALTKAMSLIADNPECIKVYNNQWQEKFLN